MKPHTRACNHHRHSHSYIHAPRPKLKTSRYRILNTKNAPRGAEHPFAIQDLRHSPPRARPIARSPQHARRVHVPPRVPSAARAVAMDTEPGARDDSDTVRLMGTRTSAPARSRVSTMRLIGINAFMFGYGAWISSFAMVTLPSESTRFFPGAESVALGSFLFIAGASQLSGPWAGYASDRTRHKLGRRRPMIIKGAYVVTPALVMMFVARTYNEKAYAASAYYVGFTASMLALNVMYTAATGIVPDLIPESQTGEANGVLAAMSAAGACTGFVYTMVYPNLGSLYWFYIGLVFVTVPITCYAANEPSTLKGDIDDDVEGADGESSALDSKFSWRELASMYYISPTEETQKSFFWLFVCRTFYYTGISAQVFLQYLLRDTAVKSDGSKLVAHEPAQAVAFLSVIGQLGGMLCAYPAGILSDYVGRRTMITISCAGIISVYFLFIYVHNMSRITYVGVYYGAMNGMFLSVDYALAIDCLPSREQSARWLAIWGIASFIGTSIGPTMFALILHFAPVTTDGATAQSGYTQMLLVGAFWMVLCTAGLVLVRPKRLGANTE